MTSLSRLGQLFALFYRLAQKLFKIKNLFFLFLDLALAMLHPNFSAVDFELDVLRGLRFVSQLYELPLPIARANRFQLYDGQQRGRELDRLLKARHGMIVVEGFLARVSGRFLSGLF